MLVAVGPMTFALALIAFMPNLWTTALMLFGLFFAYYVYEPPYRGLYPDVLPERVFGRSQGVQHVFRGARHRRRADRRRLPLPPVATGAVPRRVGCRVRRVPRADPVRDRGRRPRARLRGSPHVRRPLVEVLRSNRDVATFLVANTAWEGTFAGARTFVVLYVTVGLDEPLDDLDVHPRRGRRRLHRGGARRREDRRPDRARAGHHRRARPSTASGFSRAASEASGMRGTWA